MGLGRELTQKLGMTLVSAWERRGIIATLLLPISLVYAALVFLRHWTYQTGLRKAKAVDRTVIVVGNAIAGGAGKTPTTVSIVLHLRSCGWKVGVVSRGYGRQGDDVRAVSTKDKVASVGDEPLLMARYAELGGSLTRIAIARTDAVGTMTAWRPAMPITQWVWTKP